MTDTLTLDEAIERVADERIGRRRVHVVAEVVSYDDATRSCVVQPLQGAYRSTGEWVRLPIIHGVPVATLRMGGFVVAAPLAAGDQVLLGFTDASLERWLSGDGAVDPQDARVGHLSDAVVIAGIEPNTSAAFSTGGDLVVGRMTGGVQLRISAAGKVSLGSTAVDLVAVVHELLTALSSTVVATLAGPQPLSSASTIAALATELATIKEA